MGQCGAHKSLLSPEIMRRLCFCVLLFAFLGLAPIAFVVRCCNMTSHITSPNPNSSYAVIICLSLCVLSGLCARVSLFGCFLRISRTHRVRRTANACLCLEEIIYLSGLR